MRDLTMVANQLRRVRRAQRKFLRMWAMEQALILPALDRVAADLDGAAAQKPSADSSAALDAGAASADE